MDICRVLGTLFIRELTFSTNRLVLNEEKAACRKKKIGFPIRFLELLKQSQKILFKSVNKYLKN